MSNDQSDPRLSRIYNDPEAKLARIVDRITTQRGEWCVFVLIGMGVLAMSQAYPTLMLIAVLIIGALVFDAQNNIGLWSVLRVLVSLLQPLIPIIRGVMGLLGYALAWMLVMTGHRLMNHPSIIVVWSWCEPYTDNDHYHDHLAHFTLARRQVYAVFGLSDVAPASDGRNAAKDAVPALLLPQVTQVIPRLPPLTSGVVPTAVGGTRTFATLPPS